MLRMAVALEDSVVLQDALCQYFGSTSTLYGVLQGRGAGVPVGWPG